jgi:gamma-glutamylcyclotransferase (GGCT)/AIG2-like uncharacterized protein YtfP
MSALFTYGTLTLKPIGQSFFGNRTGIRALLKGYKRVKISFNNHILFYPALIPCPESQCDGLLFFDLTDSDWEKLDAYEGEMYERIFVTVETNNETIKAYTYRWNYPDEYSLLDEEWNPQSISEVDLRRFISDEGLSRP